MEMADKYRQQGRKEVISFIKEYFEGYVEESKKDNNTSVFDELPIHEQGSISILGLLINRLNETFEVQGG